MKKFVLLLVVLSAVVTGAKAQNYNWSIGVRGGECEQTTGIVGKYFFSSSNSLEGIIGVFDGINIVALYEWNLPVINKDFNFYYGVGGNLGSWHEPKNDEFTLGVDGVVGLEYKISKAPIAFSIDYKPCLNFIGHTGFHMLDFGLAIKLTF